MPDRRTITQDTEFIWVVGNTAQTIGLPVNTVVVLHTKNYVSGLSTVQLDQTVGKAAKGLFGVIPNGTYSRA